MSASSTQLTFFSQIPTVSEQLSNVVDLAMKNDQAATFSSVVVVSSSVTLIPSLNFTPCEHVADELVAVEPSPPLLGGVEQLVGHRERRFLGAGALGDLRAELDRREA